MITTTHRDFIKTLNGELEIAMVLGMIAELFVNGERAESGFRRVAELGYNIGGERFDEIIDAGHKAGVWVPTISSFTKSGKARTSFPLASKGRIKSVFALRLA